MEPEKENATTLATTTTDEDETANSCEFLRHAFELARKIKGCDEKAD